ncbi:MAG TPA: VWA domain-containing protein [Casimicrobiaceae bacterium]|nr:VWA domain-containing protein [Casimicrobiaceae bacterium]
MTFLWPKLLWLLLVPLLALLAYALVVRRRPGAAVRYAGLIVPVVGGARWRRLLPPLLFLLALVAMVLAVARPAAVILVPTQNEAIILAVDVSGSMRATDVKPSRIVAAQEAARAFVAAVPRKTRIGVVSFAAAASIVQYPTASRDDVLAAIDRFQLQRGTAIGSAILVALKALFPEQDFDLRGGAAPRRPQSLDAPRDADPKKAEAKKAEPVEPGSYRSAAIVLLTDGQATAGADPVEATRLAAERGVRIYTVGIGTPAGETLKVDGWSMRVRLDEDAMKAIAAGTQGEYFAATNAADLKKIYEALSSRLLFERRETEIGALFAAAGALLLALAALASQWWFNRIL